MHISHLLAYRPLHIISVKILIICVFKLLNIVGKLWLEANSLRNSLDVFPSNEGTISTRIFVIFAVSSSTHESYLLQGQLVISDYLLQERMWLWINASNLASETLLAWFLWAPVMADKSPIFPSLSDGKLLHWRLMTSCRSRFCVSAPFTPWDAIFERESWGRWFPSNYTVLPEWLFPDMYSLEISPRLYSTNAWL